MEIYKEDGNESYRKRDYYNAVNFYTEGINVKCKDDELNAKLYSNRATANFYQGKCFSSQYLLLKGHCHELYVKCEKPKDMF